MSQSSRSGGTVMYLAPYPAVLSSHWSSIVTDTVRRSSAVSSPRRTCSTAPKKSLPAAAAGSASSASSISRSAPTCAVSCGPASSGAAPGPGTEPGPAPASAWRPAGFAGVIWSGRVWPGRVWPGRVWSGAGRASGTGPASALAAPGARAAPVVPAGPTGAPAAGPRCGWPHRHGPS
jgi:hypothetical protein